MQLTNFLTGSESSVLECVQHMRKRRCGGADMPSTHAYMCMRTTTALTLVPCMQQYQGRHAAAQNATSRPLRGATHPVLPLKSDTTYGTDYAPHTNARVRPAARLQKKLPTIAKPTTVTHAYESAASAPPGAGALRQYAYVKNPHKCDLPLAMPPVRVHVVCIARTGASCKHALQGISTLV